MNFSWCVVASIKQQVLMSMTDSGPDGLTPREQLVAIHRTVTALLEQQMTHWRQTLRPRLSQAGIHILDYTDLKKRQIKRLADYFEREIFPVLTPLAFDRHLPAHLQPEHELGRGHSRPRRRPYPFCTGQSAQHLAPPCAAQPARSR